MPAKNKDLHGMVPDKSPVVLLLIDLINDFDFPEGKQLLEHTKPVARRVAALKERARAADVAVVYVNDNFGRWRSDFRVLLSHVLDEDGLGHSVARQLVPDANDYFVIKPKHSAFYSTTLDTLLDYLGAKTLILTGVAGNICVLFSANDAFLRDYNLLVPADCCASNLPEDNEHALHLMQSVLKADTRPSSEIDFLKLQADLRNDPEPDNS